MPAPGGRRLARLSLLLAATLAGGALTSAGKPPPRWWAPGDGRVFPATLDYADGSGTLGLMLAGGLMATRGHPFFERSGPAGRACVTCHQPADSMSLSAATARER